MDIKDIFNRSNELICNNINSYFPGGTTDSRGWYTLKNFDRGEQKAGSFGICVSGEMIGAVKDFADESYNTNVTCFYASVNGLSNMDGAKKILQNEDNDFYDKAFNNKKIKRTPIIPIPEDIFSLDFDEYCLNDKKLSNNIDWFYEYRNVQNKLLYISCRLKEPFKDNKGKKRKLLAVGYFKCKQNDKEWSEFSWYEQTFKGKPYPFSNQYELSKLGNRSVIIVEGEKAAYYLSSVLDSKKWIITCNGGSSNMKNPKSYDVFEKLNINHVFLWPDNDEAGKGVIGFVKERFDKVSVLKIPDDYPDKWDAADAVFEGWDSGKIENFIYNNLYTTEEVDPQYFKALSHDHDNFYFMSYRLGLVKPVKQEAITLGFLKIMAPRDYWINKYPVGDGMKSIYDTDTAIEDIISMAMVTPYHENNKIRQIGAWEDDGRYVFHYGTGLIVNGQRVDLFNFKTNYIYEKKGYLSFSEDGYKPVNLRKIANIIKRFSISSKQEKYFFIGWIVMAILGGAFDWRPHIWLTGEAGSGKTSAIDFIQKILGSSAILETGGSTEAGIRQRLKVSTLPVLIDELEGIDDKTSSNLKAIKALIRQASSGARVSRGTSNHAGIDFAIQSMFCVGSISPQIAEGADLSRFAIINFDKSIQGENGSWTETEAMMEEILTPEYINELKFFMVSNLNNVMAALKKAFKVFSELGYSSRLNQQYSVLTIGAYICTTNSFDFTEEEYKKFLVDKFDFYDQSESGNTTAAEQCFSIILQKIIDYKSPNGLSEKTSIFELLVMYKKELDNTTDPKKVLMQNIIKAVKSYGFLLDNRLCNNDILFVYNASYVKEILKYTSFSGDIKEILKRHPFADMKLTPTVYAGGKGSAIRFSYDVLLDERTLEEESKDSIPF